MCVCVCLMNNQRPLIAKSDPLIHHSSNGWAGRRVRAREEEEEEGEVSP